jgi:hypothetical protein
MTRAELEPLSVAVPLREDPAGVFRVGTADPVILEWAATEGRVLLTHDRDRIPNFAYDRVRAGEPMPGVFLVSDRMPKGQAVEELFLAIHCLLSDECKDLVTYFPL